MLIELELSFGVRNAYPRMHFSLLEQASALDKMGAMQATLDVGQFTSMAPASGTVRHIQKVYVIAIEG